MEEKWRVTIRVCGRNQSCSWKEGRSNMQVAWEHHIARAKGLYCFILFRIFVVDFFTEIIFQTLPLTGKQELKWHFPYIWHHSFVFKRPAPTISAISLIRTVVYCVCVCGGGIFPQKICTPKAVQIREILTQDWKLGTLPTAANLHMNVP